MFTLCSLILNTEVLTAMEMKQNQSPAQNVQKNLLMELILTPTILVHLKHILTTNGAMHCLPKTMDTSGTHENKSRRPGAATCKLVNFVDDKD